MPSSSTSETAEMVLPIRDISDLLRLVEARRDETGCLRAVARMFEPLPVRMLFLADAGGHVTAVEQFDSEMEIELAGAAAERLAERLRQDETFIGEAPSVCGPMVLVGVRFDNEDGSQMLGLLSEAAPGAEASFRRRMPSLLAASSLAASAVAGWIERRKVHTEIKHLRAEHTTLKAAHTEAMLAAITEREQRQSAEAQQAALEQYLRAAERANRSKSEFLAHMSHEIRTPMTAILGFADVLLTRLSHAEDRDAVSTIRRHGQALIEILDDILDLSKIEAGKFNVEAMPASPQQIVEDVASLMSVRAENKKLRLEIEYATAIPKTVHTDPTRLRQILFNLVGNAIKFTDTGEVRLIVRFRNDPAAVPALEFDVADTGIGMSDEQVAMLFSPFTQLDATRQRQYGGTGLGLAISKRLAEMLGGDIAVRSAPGRGSVFTVTIPTGAIDPGLLVQPDAVSVAQRRPKTPEPPRSPEKLDARILLVEDGPDNQRLITFFLKKAGAEVVLANNGQEALDRFRQAKAARRHASGSAAQPFDAILMDIEMPVLDGHAATRRLREEGYTGAIIALTAHAMAHHVEECLWSGCDAHVAKPIDFNTLLATIRRHLPSPSRV